MLLDNKIYALVCPVIGRVRYVGKTKGKLTTRLSAHLGEINNKSKKQWVDSLKENGLRPSIILIESVEESQIDIREKYWIAHYLSDDLLNVGHNTLLHKKKPKGIVTKTIELPKELSCDLKDELTKQKLEVNFYMTEKELCVQLIQEALNFRKESRCQ